MPEKRTETLTSDRDQRPGGYYFVKTPWWFRLIWPSYTWRVPEKEKILYLTFDDGPHPEATEFVLDVLKQFGARATFFCIGKNVAANPRLYQRILEEGHTTGNHTHHHLNGWKTLPDAYIADTAKAATHINSKLFRPPYGRITRKQARLLNAYKIIMWDVLSGDFDITLSNEKCAHHVIWNARPGSIIVFHDSEKALPRLQYALPAVLSYFTAQGYRFKHL